MLLILMYMKNIVVSRFLICKLFLCTLYFNYEIHFSSLGHYISPFGTTCNDNRQASMYFEQKLNYMQQRRRL